MGNTTLVQGQSPLLLFPPVVVPAVAVSTPVTEPVVGVPNNTVYIWDVISAHSRPALIGTFFSHHNRIYSPLHSSLIPAYNNRAIGLVVILQTYWQQI